MGSGSSVEPANEDELRRRAKAVALKNYADENNNDAGGLLAGSGWRIRAKATRSATDWEVHMLEFLSISGRRINVSVWIESVSPEGHGPGNALQKDQDGIWRGQQDAEGFWLGGRFEEPTAVAGIRLQQGSCHGADDIDVEVYEESTGWRVVSRAYVGQHCQDQPERLQLFPVSGMGPLPGCAPDSARFLGAPDDRCSDRYSACSYEEDNEEEDNDDDNEEKHQEEEHQEEEQQEEELPEAASRRASSKRSNDDEEHYEDDHHEEEPQEDAPPQEERRGQQQEDAPPQEEEHLEEEVHEPAPSEEIMEDIVVPPPKEEAPAEEVEEEVCPEE